MSQGDDFHRGAGDDGPRRAETVAIGAGGVVGADGGRRVGALLQAAAAAVMLVMVAFAPARNFLLSAVGFADTHFRTLVISGAETEECYHVGRLLPGAMIGDAQVFTVGGVGAVAGTDIAVSTRSSVEVVWAARDGTILDAAVLPPGKPTMSAPAMATLAVVFPTGTNFATGGASTPHRWWQATAPTVELGGRCGNGPLPDHV